jgi:drug/metabolite transporter (DMT)-like permease
MMKNKPNWRVVFLYFLIIVLFAYAVWINLFARELITLRWISGGTLILLGIIFLVIDWFMERKGKE